MWTEVSFSDFEGRGLFLSSNRRHDLRFPLAILGGGLFFHVTEDDLRFTLYFQGAGGAFLPNFQTKFKFDKIYIYSHKVTELSINKHFACVKIPYLVWNHNKLVCCGSPKEVPITPAALTQMTDLRYLSPDVTVSGGAFLANFQLNFLSFQINYFIIIGGFNKLYRSNNLFIDLKARYWCPLWELWISMSYLFMNPLWNDGLNIGLPNLHQMSLSQGRWGWGGFSAQFSGILIFNIDAYYRDITSCSKCITNGFVIYPDNDIQA